MKHLKIILLAVSLAAAAILWLANRSPSPAPFTLSYSDVMASLGSLGGEIVEVVGADQNSTYRWHGEVTLPYGLQDGVQVGPSGTSRGGLTMAFPIAADHNHVIHIYDSSDGRALLVGRKIPLKSQTASAR